MRIISGTLGGRKLVTSPGEGMRPAMGKTREALFSMLDARGICWGETLVLDLFAGCGSLAFEALSRGAPQAWLVDNAGGPCSSIRANAEKLGVVANARVFQEDVSAFLKRRPPASFQLAFIDPPYHRNLAGKAIQLLEASGWLAPEAFVVAEIEKNASLEPCTTLVPEVDRLFGQTRLKIWKKI